MESQTNESVGDISVNIAQHNRLRCLTIRSYTEGLDR